MYFVLLAYISTYAYYLFTKVGVLSYWPNKGQECIPGHYDKQTSIPTKTRSLIIYNILLRFEQITCLTGVTVVWRYAENFMEIQ